MENLHALISKLSVWAHSIVANGGPAGLCRKKGHKTVDGSECDACWLDRQI